jgi:Skp family chaperone for outer membrane proteins
MPIRPRALFALVLLLPAVWLFTPSERGSEVHGQAGLGPDVLTADAVRLEPRDGGPGVELQAADGHLAWGPNATDRAYAQGYVHINTLLQALMADPARATEREAIAAGLAERENDYRARLEELAKAMRDTEPGTAASQRADDAGRALYEEYQAWQRDAITQRGRLDAQQLEQSYRAVLAAVRTVAARDGIDIVHRFVPADEPFGTENPEQAMMAIRLRTALYVPEGLDITAAVRAELGLPAPADG